jgi:ferrous iron transport protein B
MKAPARRTCAACVPSRAHKLVQLGIDMKRWDYVVALAGNPNTGKSTVFNRLTGLRQHTGNWPGKTVTRAEGGFSYANERFKLVDLPGTYSLLSTSRDEQIARDFLLLAQPDVTVVIVDATCLERNLNLALQVLEITERAVVCVNLLDQAQRAGLEIDGERLLVLTAARSGEGIDNLIEAIHDVATGRTQVRPRRLHYSREIEDSVRKLETWIEATRADLPNRRWIALRLLEGDGSLADGSLSRVASTLRDQVGHGVHDSVMETIFREASSIAERATSRRRAPAFDLSRGLDRAVTNRLWAGPIMVLLLASVLWITIVGANYPSALLDELLIQRLHPALKNLAAAAGLPWWLQGALLDGTYLALAWVVSVMLPPMAIFFPLFTLLEDFGYLPRVAFNLDGPFRRAGAHGKQALTMCMGFGCNAAGVIAARVIDSPRERLIAILTNNFALCNGRWPTQILIAGVFVGCLVPAHLSGLVSAGVVMLVALLGIGITFVVSWALSRTILRGEVSAFSLELPPYRPPRLLQTLYTSLIDRTIFVLWRAMVFAAPAGLVIWLVANVPAGEVSLAERIIGLFDPAGVLIGLNGIILLAYVVAIPANEIVIPTVLMLTVMTSGLTGVGGGAGVMFELDSASEMGGILRAGGWTLLTGVNLLLFSLLHNPCSTTLFTIWKETRSARWTWLAALLPLALGVTACFFVAQIWRLVAGG